MGGGDLNTKKSWHPTNRSNQERVWKAEQKEAAEKKRLAELQREIQDERDREELKNIARSSGFLDDGDQSNKKLEWMYKGQQLNREEYLTGRAIDKNFEQLDAEEKARADPINNPAISKPINHVEHEVIPFSIRQYKGLPGTEQVDMARKMMEDPLMLIKQKEMEQRKEILQNPVKLKELHKMLKEERNKKKSKKEKKSKKKHKKSRSDSDNSDVDLDKALAEKYKRLQGALANDLDSDDDANDGNVDKILSLKFEALSKELDKMTGSKKKKKKKKRDSSSSSDDFGVSKKNEESKRKRSRSPMRRDNRQRRTPENVRRRSRSPQRNFRDQRNDNRRYNSPDRFRNNQRNRNFSPRRRSPSNWNQQRYKRSPSRSPNRRQRNQSPERRNNRSRTPERRGKRSRSPVRHQKHSSTPEKRNRSPERRQKRSKTPEKRQRSPPEPKSNRNRSPSSASTSSSDSSSPQNNDDSDDGRPAKKTFGLVTSDGKGIVIKNPITRRRSASPRKDKSSKTSVLSKQEPTKARPTRMTQEEIDARLKEMISNASWREKDRTEKVHKYRENEKREQEEAKQDFDKDFMTKQLKKTANSTTSVESRIKSNLNNIQRSSRTMESNFARR